MKTPEDEAFEDIERRQGGGFPAKRAMVADKFIAIEERKVGERYGYVPKLHPSEWMDEPAQEPVECLDCGSNNVGIPATYDSLVDSVKSQPAQEPVAWRWGIKKLNGGYEWRYTLHKTQDNSVPLYAAPPKRPWVGLTDEERESIAQDYSLTGFGYQSPFKAIEAKLKEKNA